MNTLPSLLQKRQQIIEELGNLGPVRRGSITEQHYESTLADGRKVRRGPYLLYSYKEKQRTVSCRLTDGAQVSMYRQQIAAYRQFQRLTSELVAVGERIADVALTQDVTFKKTRRFGSSGSRR